MKRQLKLEALISKASAYLSAATYEELPARLRDVSLELSLLMGIERVGVWIYSPEEGDYVPIHWWPEYRDAPDTGA